MADLSRYTVNWNYPTAIRCGIGRIADLPAACRSLGMGRPLLVTDPGLADTAMVKEAAASAGAGIFSRIKGNPTGRNIDDGLAAFRDGRHDGVIAFGGGSALDAGKAIALMAGQDRPLWDFEDVGDNASRVKTEGMAPVVAVPTTAGTGSEVGRASVITDEAARVKRIIFHPRMLPAIVILDAQLTVGLPPRLTAATGMDAMSHNLEAWCSPVFHPMAAGIALEGMRLVKQWLPSAVADGRDLQARAEMLCASAMGATAFQRGLGAMHALAHPLGAHHDAHHGTLNAVLMPYVLKANRPAIEDRIVAAGRYLDLREASFEGFLEWLLALRSRIGIPHGLSALGIDGSDADEIAAMAVADPSHATNPAPLTQAQYREIYLAAVEGVL
jgi:alcohol dehydrogenase class IV